MRLYWPFAVVVVVFIIVATNKILLTVSIILFLQLTTTNTIYIKIYSQYEAEREIDFKTETDIYGCEIMKVCSIQIRI